MDHFVTLFDSSFLLQGLALYDSLVQHREPFVLWVLCVDEPVECSLNRLSLSHMKTIPLREVEECHEQLLTVKPGRSRAEYCWTLTPFAPEAVLRREPGAAHVTYIDADVYCFGPPSLLLEELIYSGAHVLLTDHARAPEYRPNRRSGRFCVQFLPFANDSIGLEIMQWWQDRCIEWCYARFEDDKFGDQKYLETWPDKWGSAVHILVDSSLTLAPWNVDYLLSGGRPRGMYHFHGFRLFSGGEVRMWRNYSICESSYQAVYIPYMSKVREIFEKLHRCGIRVQLPDVAKGVLVGSSPLFDTGKCIEGWTRV